MALADLERTFSGYLAQALAPSTLQMYQSGQGRLPRFCMEACLQPMPLGEHSLYLCGPSGIPRPNPRTLLHEGWLSASAIEQTQPLPLRDPSGIPRPSLRHMSAVHYFHIMGGHRDPFSPGFPPRLQYVVRGFKWMPRPPSHLWLPLTPPLLQAIKTCWEARAAEFDTVMLRSQSACV